jgi:putative ABC transport system permease protein
VTFAHFAYKNCLRNKRRTTLTIVSIAFSLFLLATLVNVLKMLEMPETDDSHLRLVVRRATSLQDPVPASYGQKLKAVPGVRLVMPLTWFQGIWRDEDKNFFANFACDPSVLFDVYQEIVIAPAQREAFQREKTAAIAGKLTADRFGWKVGDRIHLVSQIYVTPSGAPVETDLILRGIYTTTIKGVDANFFFHHEYFDELTGREGRVGTFWVKVNSLADIPIVSATIDQMFRSTSAETKTETEKAFGASFSAMLGNVKQLLGTLSAIIVLTILLVVTSTMAMSIRERTPEIAVLKTLGFKRGLIFRILVAESVGIALTGGLVGLLAGFLFFASFDISKKTNGMIPFFQFDAQTMLIGMLAALAIGLISAGIPAFLAVRQGVLSGLRQVG